MRIAEINRKTAETDIQLVLNLDGKGDSKINSGSGFFDHMLTLFARHGSFDLELDCKGDTEVDLHHSVEDIGICLGDAFKTALGDMRGITRYGSMLLPMDEALIMTAVDISGRPYLRYRMKIPAPMVGDFDTELLREFVIAFAFNAGITLHIRRLDGVNSHHIIEGTFKSLGRTLKKAVAIDEKAKDEIPSTKGVL